MKMNLMKMKMTQLKVFLLFVLACFIKDGYKVPLQAPFLEMKLPAASRASQACPRHRLHSREVF